MFKNIAPRHLAAIPVLALGIAGAALMPRALLSCGEALGNQKDRYDYTSQGGCGGFDVCELDLCGYPGNEGWIEYCIGYEYFGRYPGCS